MPFEWNNTIVVTKDELVPGWFTDDTLAKTIQRYANKPVGIKRVQLGGNGRQMLISYDSLPENIKTVLGDPRKVNHILERYYKVDGAAVTYYTQEFQFDDGSYLDLKYQERYIVNASMVKALFELKEARENERRTKGGSLTGIMKTLCADAISFQKTLQVKHQTQHSLPACEKKFKQALKDFQTDGYKSLISGKHKNNNSRKVFDHTLELLNNLFADSRMKPTATEVYEQYSGFLNGYVDVVRNDTGELYNPKEFKRLSIKTVTDYMAQWVNKIGTHAARSGDRQKYMQKFKTPHGLDKPTFAGSILSIDDRQPPFIYNQNKDRVWFYNGIDLHSEAFTCWVPGRTKEGLILEFYRQLVRNYAEWNINLPAELEAEMSLNSSFVNTFLREGAMFQYVRIEANNARGKRIEAYYRPLRYKLEKKRIGWLARPHALSESNQSGPDKVQIVPYDDIIEGCLQDIETWNNMPHTLYPELTRWDVFLQNQNPDLKPTNYLAILPYLGYKTPTSCNTGIIQLQSKKFLLGDNGSVSTGEKLISFMKQVEGKDIDVYWLNDNDGGILKALVFIGTQYICEAVAQPTYNRARIEQTPQDHANRELMSKYVATIEAFGRNQKRTLEQVTIINNQPAARKAFVMRGLRQTHEDYVPAGALPPIPEDDNDLLPEPSYARSLKDRY
jgi:hypothetical protein